MRALFAFRAPCAAKIEDFPLAQVCFKLAGMKGVIRWRRAIARAMMVFVLAHHGQAAVVFRDLTEAAGLREPLLGLMGHGGAWGILTGTGRIDLFVGGFSDRPNAEYAPAAGPVANRLFRNLGQGRFERIANPAVETFARTSGAVFADLDNDGFPELYVANNARAQARRGGEPQSSAQTRRSQLFRNDGGRLLDFSGPSGACPDSLLTARNIGALDYNQDGLLDLLLIEDRFTRNPRTRLLRNLGGLRFSDATQEAGLPNDLFGLGHAVADLNNDGAPDFFIGHANRLFLSQPGGRYREAAELREVFKHAPADGEDWPCGAAFGDLNRDGRLDLVVSAHAVRARNRLFLNDGLKEGVPQFREITREAGLLEIVPAKCPHVEIQDFDNDGWPDLYFSAAWLEDGQVTPLIYRHQGLQKGLPRFAASRTVKEPMVYYPAGPSGDFDGDGRLDLFLINWFSGNWCRLLRNESPERHWLQVRVTGRRSNRMGLGAQIRLYAAGQMGNAQALLGCQEMNVGFGYASGQPAVAHFGLGDVTETDLEVRFPNGQTVARRAVKAGALALIEEP